MLSSAAAEMGGWGGRVHTAHMHHAHYFSQTLWKNAYSCGICIEQVCKWQSALSAIVVSCLYELIYYI